MNEEITPKKEINQKFKDNPALIAAAQAGDRRAADRLVRQNGGHFYSNRRTETELVRNGPLCFKNHLFID